MSKRSSFRDTAFIRFSFKMILKKTSIYLTILLYLILIISYTSLVPIISKVEPITLFSSPTSAMFLMFGMALVSTFIAIEVFRTSIDDGTELLTISKPLSRIEIVMGKLIIFISYILFIGIISAILASFMFVHGYGLAKDNLIIFLGILIATIINGIFFGSIATFISLYKKKVISMIITLSFTFILMVFSILTSFMIKSPIKLMQEENKTILPTSYVDIDQKNKNVSILQGAYIPSLATNEETQKPSELWNEFKKKSSFEIISYFDIGYQLSSIYTLNVPSENVVSSIQMMSVFNSPIKLNFTDYNFNENYKTKILFDFSPLALDNNKNLNGNMLLKFNSSTRFISKEYPEFNEKKYFDLNEIKTINKKANDSNNNVSFENDFWNIDVFSDSSNSSKINMSQFLSQEVERSRNEASSKGPNAYDDLGNLFLSAYWRTHVKEKKPINEKIMENWFDNLNLSIYKWYMSAEEISFFDLFHIEKDIDQTLTIEEILNSFKKDLDLTDEDINKIILLIQNKLPPNSIDKNTNVGKIVEMLKSKNIDIYNQIIEKAEKNRNIYRTILSLMGLKIDGYIDKTNLNLSKIANKFMNQSDTSFSIEKKYKIKYKSAFYLYPEMFVGNFQKVESVALLNTNALISAWTLITISIFAITMVLYSRRDFA